MNRIAISLFAALAIFPFAPNVADAAAADEQRVKNAVMTLIKAETRGDGLYHVEDKYNQKKLALKFEGLDRVEQRDGLQVVTARFKEGSTPHRIEYYVSTSGGDTGAPVQVTKFILDGQDVPSGAVYDKRPTAIHTSKRYVPGSGVVEETTRPLKGELPTARSRMENEREPQDESSFFEEGRGAR